MNGGDRGRHYDRPRQMPCRVCGAPVDRGRFCGKCYDRGIKAAGDLDASGYGEYYDGNGRLKPEYVDQKANDLALAFAVAELSKHQLRAFFDAAKRLEAAISLRGGPGHADLQSDLAMFKAHANARQGRRRIPPVFVKFIERNVDRALVNEQSFRGFVKHFEAVVAYCEGRLKDRESES